MSSKKEDNDFFGIEYIQNQPYKEQENEKIMTEANETHPRQSGTEFLDSTFFPELSNKSNQHGEDSNEKSLVDKEDVFSDYFVARSGKSMAETSDDYQRNDPRREKLEVIDTSEFVSFAEERGFKKILDYIEPVWKYSPKELVDLLSQRIVYDSEDIIAFDKPYQMAYSGSTEKQAQMDRILQDLKRVVAPNVERLHLIKSLDKACSGIVLFAKNAEAQKKYIEMLKTDAISLEYRTIVKNIPKVREAEIKVPVKRFMKGQDFELRPLIAATKEKVFYPVTTYRVMEKNDRDHCSYLKVDVKNEIPHQIRCHLGYGVGCPILGDLKYANINNKNFANLSSGIHARLELNNKNESKKLPMYLHLREVRIPLNKSGTKYVAIKADIPQFFHFTLKRLSLLRK